MTTTSTTKTERPPYRVPRVYPECDPVSLSDFRVEDIKEYLKQRHQIEGGPGHVSNDDALIIEADELSRIETLALCGQLEHARSYALSIISDHLGRPL